MVERFRAVLVEDSREDAELLLHFLRKRGIELEARRVETARDFAAALDEAPGWDIVISDFTVPGFSGMEAFRMFKEREIDVPFIIVSGTVGEEAAIEAMRLGVHDYFLKGNLARLPGAISREVREARDRKQAARALVEKEARYQSIFRSAAVGLVELDFTVARAWLRDQGVTSKAGVARLLEVDSAGLDDATARVRVGQCNDKARDLLGLAECPATAAGLRAPAMRLAWIEILSVVAVGEGDVEVTCRLGDTARYRHVLLSLHLQPSTLHSAVMALSDVSRQHELERQMRASQRLEAVGRLAGGVAHDFNNVLTVIHSYTGFLREQLAGKREVLDDVRTIEDAAERAARLTSQLLAFSRRQVQQLATFSLRTAVEEVEGLLGRLLGEDIDIILELDDDVGSVEADQTQIEQIVMNLAINARDAMPRGGKLHMRTYNTDVEDRLACVKGKYVEPGPYVLLEIEDTGVGIPAEDFDNLFEPFFTTKEPGKGTGLGLATVLGIALQCGGGVAIDTELGRGTKFRVFLPRVDPAGERRSVAKPGPRGDDRGSERVLVVEDEALLRRAAKRALEYGGYQVITARDAEEGLELAARADEHLDLVITDVVLPGMGGRELFERLSESHPETRVLLMTGYTNDELIRHGVREGEVALLQKPFTPKQLRQVVRSVLDL